MELYTVAATVLEKFERKQGSVKSLVFGSGFKNIRKLYALVCESLKYQHVLTSIFKGSHSLQQEEALQGQGHLATVLLYEHLLGKGLGQAGRIRKCIENHKREIQQKCQQLLEEKGVTSLADLLTTKCQTLNKLPMPRFARVNLLKRSVGAAREGLVWEGWVWRGTLGLATFPEDVRGLGEDGFGADPLLPDLLIFPPGTDLHDHPWVMDGSLVLQDRASCFPAHVLNAARDSVVLDCCAAPGNKTSHTASLMANTGQIWAFERDGRRMGLLQQQLGRTGVTNTSSLHNDFLSSSPGDQRFTDVQYVLVDPSCSGSGIMSRMDHVNSSTPAGQSKERLRSLQRFQISILRHALRFPRVRRVVYSTCSVHEEENEQVVSQVLGKVGGQFQLKNIFPEFPHRGKGANREVAEKCMRMSPENDLTNGFFVACFERRDPHDSGESERGCETNGGNINEQTSAEEADVPLLKKNRKRKRVDDSSHTDSAAAFTSCSAGDSTAQNGEPESETAESPKKKRKKKKKKEKASKEAGKNEGKDWEETEDRSQNTGTNSSEAASLNDDPVVKKHKTSKKESARDLSQSSVCVSSHPTNATENMTIGENTAAKAKKKKKDKKSAEEKNSSTLQNLQTQEPDLPTLAPASDTESVVKKRKKKQKKKKKKQLESEQQTEHDSEKQLTASQKQNMTPSPNSSSSNQSSERAKKRKKR